MDTFASHAHCSKTTIYTLGVDKEQLVATLYRRFFREATATIEERIAPIATERERIATYLDAIGSHMSRMSNACYIDMTQHDATLEIYGTNARVSAERVRLFIERGISTGEFGGTNAHFIGEAVWLLIEGIHHGVLLDRTHLTSGQAYREIAELVLKALTNTART
jgi:AcrR family transcriptional regulator